MNILYISPYRNRHTHNECLNNIKTLSGSASITIYPIYIDSDTIEPDKELIELESKNVFSDNYDIVVQHAPLEYLIPFSSVVKKNYCIPIIKYCKNLKAKSLNKLLNFDMVLSDSKYDADFISSSFNHTKLKKIKLFNYTNFYDNNKKANLFYHNTNYKLYTFINKNNSYLIYKILLAFFIASQDISNCSLVLAVETDALATKTKALVDDFIKKHNINNVETFIKIIVVSQDTDSILAFHKACDCYIEFRDTTNCHFHNFIAKECDNAFITNENLDIYYEPNIEKGEDFGELYPALNISSLANKIKNIVRTKSIHRTDSIQTLDKIICK